MTEKDLQQAVRVLFHNHEYVLVNSFVFNWESDFFSMTKNGNAYEVEMKVSRADFRRDFEKEKHRMFKNAGSGMFQERDPTERISGDHAAWYFDYSTRKSGYYPFCKMAWRNSETFFIPNRFYYACPPGIIPLNELPRYAGMIHVDGNNAAIIKQAPFLHKRPLLDGRLQKILLDKFWWLSQHMRGQLRHHKIDFKDCRINQK